MMAATERPPVIWQMLLFGNACVSHCLPLDEASADEFDECGGHVLYGVAVNPATGPERRVPAVADDRVCGSLEECPRLQAPATS